MLHKTTGIVLKTTNYAETSVIAKIYTQKFGLQAYIINGVKKPSSKIRTNMLQALTVLDMVVYHKKQAGIQRISEATCAPVLLTIPYNIVKSSIALFINEMLYKALKHPTHEPLLFVFLENAIVYLDQTTENCSNFAPVFLLKLTRFLGFNPDVSYADSASYFDLLNGIFVNILPPHPHYISANYITNWVNLLRCPLTQTHLLTFNASTRKYFLQQIINFYNLHIEGFGDIKSHLVLEEVLN